MVDLEKEFEELLGQIRKTILERQTNGFYSYDEATVLLSKLPYYFTAEEMHSISEASSDCEAWECSFY